VFHFGVALLLCTPRPGHERRGRQDGQQAARAMSFKRRAYSLDCEKYRDDRERSHAEDHAYFRAFHDSRFLKSLGRTSAEGIGTRSYICVMRLAHCEACTNPKWGMFPNRVRIILLGSKRWCDTLEG
jgi:hypothetical protein